MEAEAVELIVGAQVPRGVLHPVVAVLDVRKRGVVANLGVGAGAGEMEFLNLNGCMIAT